MGEGLGGGDAAQLTATVPSEQGIFSNFIREILPDRLEANPGWYAILTIYGAMPIYQEQNMNFGEPNCRHEEEDLYMKLKTYPHPEEAA